MLVSSSCVRETPEMAPPLMTCLGMSGSTSTWLGPGSNENSSSTTSCVTLEPEIPEPDE